VAHVANVRVDRINLNSLSQSSPNLGSDRGSASHNESSQPTSPGEKRGRQSLKCTVDGCSIFFTLESARKRHYEERHSDQPHSTCHKCCQEWTREYEHRKHLKRKHNLEDDEINDLLGPPKQRRGKGKVIESGPPPHSSPPPIECDRQSLAEPHQRPLMPPFLAVGKEANHASQLLIPHAEPEVTTTDPDHEDSSGLKHYGATHAPPRFLSGEEFVLLVTYARIHGEFRFVHAFLYATYTIDSALRLPPVYPEGSTTADISPNPGMPHIPAFSSPVAGHHTSPVSGDPMVEPSGSTDPIYTPVTDDCENGTNAFAALDGCRVDLTSTDASSSLGPVELDSHPRAFCPRQGQPEDLQILAKST
jgi:hypothetical protein